MQRSAWQRDSAVLATALALVGVASAVTWSGGPGRGLLVLTGVVLAIRLPSAVQIGTFHRGRRAPGRTDRAQIHTDVSFVGDIRSAFAAVATAQVTGRPTAARTWMTADCARRWRDRMIAVTPERWATQPSRVIEWSVISRTHASRDAAWVRVVVASASEADLIGARHRVEHWSFVRSAAEPVVVRCSGCQDNLLLSPDASSCPHCGASVRVPRSRWIVEAIVAPCGSAGTAVRAA